MALLCILICSAFAPPQDNSYFKNDGSLLAVIDGKNFELRDKDRYHAELVYKTASINKGNNIVKHVATSISFFGTTIKDEKGNDFKEKMEFEYGFNEGALGEPTEIKLELNYDRKSYYILPEQSKINVTKVDWSADRRSFVLSADFDCVMRKWGYPSDSQPTIKLKGKMENIQVSVPGWINIKNPTQQADGK
jgi:hypothetical protein